MSAEVWQRTDFRGTAAEAHLFDAVEEQRVVRQVEIDSPALVVGPTQRGMVLSDVDVVQRKSGGGAVWLAPGEQLWIDVSVPRSDRLWEDDVGLSFDWLGNLWAGVFRQLGVTDLVVHSGPLEVRDGGEVVCFATVGPGEVLVGAGGPKLVGISQRRTRAAALYQCMVCEFWDPSPYLAALTADLETVALDISGVGVGYKELGIDANDLAPAFFSALASV